jgi:hypothetical protein
MSINYISNTKYLSVDRQIQEMTWAGLNETANYVKDVFRSFEKLNKKAEFQTNYPDAYTKVSYIRTQLQLFNDYMKEKGAKVKLGHRIPTFEPLWGGEGIVKKTTRATLNLYHWSKAYGLDVIPYFLSLQNDQHFKNDLPLAIVRINNVLNGITDFLDYMQSKGIDISSTSIESNIIPIPHATKPNLPTVEAE